MGIHLHPLFAHCMMVGVILGSVLLKIPASRWTFLGSPRWQNVLVRSRGEYFGIFSYRIGFVVHHRLLFGPLDDVTSQPCWKVQGIWGLICEAGKLLSDKRENRGWRRNVVRNLDLLRMIAPQFRIKILTFFGKLICWSWCLHGVLLGTCALWSMICRKLFTRVLRM